MKDIARALRSPHAKYRQLTRRSGIELALAVLRASRPGCPARSRRGPSTSRRCADACHGGTAPVAFSCPPMGGGLFEQVLLHVRRQKAPNPHHGFSQSLGKLFRIRAFRSLIGDRCHGKILVRSSHTNVHEPMWFQPGTRLGRSGSESQGQAVQAQRAIVG